LSSTETSQPVLERTERLGPHEFPPTAQKILKAARRVLLKKGYSSLTVQAIQKEAGVNGALIHYYFGSKAGLIEALVETLFESPEFGFSDQVSQAGEGEEKRLALLEWLGRISQDRQAGRLLYELLPHILRSKMLREYLGGLYVAYREFDAECLASGTPSLDGQTLAALGALSVAVVEGISLQAAVDPKGVDSEATYAAWREMLAYYMQMKEVGGQCQSS
jgi:AcrR family transcriptional regulator